jgi:hypothetical protein
VTYKLEGLLGTTHCLEAAAMTFIAYCELNTVTVSTVLGPKLPQVLLLKGYKVKYQEIFWERRQEIKERNQQV